MFETDAYVEDSIAYIINSDMDSDIKVKLILMLIKRYWPELVKQKENNYGN